MDDLEDIQFFQILSKELYPIWVFRYFKSDLIYASEVNYDKQCNYTSESVFLPLGEKTKMESVCQFSDSTSIDHFAQVLNRLDIPDFFLKLGEVRFRKDFQIILPTWFYQGEHERENNINLSDAIIERPPNIIKLKDD